MIWVQQVYHVFRAIQNLAVKSERIYVMYHGTSPKAAIEIVRHGFTPSKDGMLGPGVYLSRDLKNASRYPLNLPEESRVVIRVRVNVGKVKKIDRQGHEMQKTWHDRGYDTAWFPSNSGMVRSGLEENCVWDPRRIQVIDVIHPKRTRSFACYFFLLLSIHVL